VVKYKIFKGVTKFFLFLLYIKMPLGRGSHGIGGPGFSDSTGRGTGTGTGTGDSLREAAKYRREKEEAERKNAILKRARATRIKHALSFMRRRLDEKQKPGVFNVIRRRVSDAIYGKPTLPTRKEAERLATMEVDAEIAKKAAADRKYFAKIREQHGLGGGRKTKKHRNKKNNTKSRR
jgi:hypothetical protein